MQEQEHDIGNLINILEQRLEFFSINYGRAFMELDVNALEINALNKFLFTANSVIELGVGCGRIAFWLKEKWPDLIVYAVDNSKQFLDFCVNQNAGKDLDIKFIHTNLLTSLRTSIYENATCLGNTFGSFLRKKDRVAFWDTLANHLPPHGVLILDFVIPHGDFTSRRQLVLKEEDGMIIETLEEYSPREFVKLPYFYPFEHKLFDTAAEFGLHLVECHSYQEPFLNRKLAVFKKNQF